VRRVSLGHCCGNLKLKTENKKVLLSLSGSNFTHLVVGCRSQELLHNVSILYLLIIEGKYVMVQLPVSNNNFCCKSTRYLNISNVYSLIFLFNAPFKRMYLFDNIV
jgi:hypothetical protein